MAEAHHKSETGAPTNKSRRYTVGHIREHIKHLPSPSIMLKGYRMAEFGFSIGQKIEVISEAVQLIIRLTEE